MLRPKRSDISNIVAFRLARQLEIEHFGTESGTEWSSRIHNEISCWKRQLYGHLMYKPIHRCFLDRRC